MGAWLHTQRVLRPASHACAAKPREQHNHNCHVNITLCLGSIPERLTKRCPACHPNIARTQLDILEFLPRRQWAVQAGVGEGLVGPFSTSTELAPPRTVIIFALAKRHFVPHFGPIFMGCLVAKNAGATDGPAHAFCLRSLHSCSLSDSRKRESVGELTFDSNTLLCERSTFSFLCAGSVLGFATRLHRQGVHAFCLETLCPMELSGKSGVPVAHWTHAAPKG
jgi:hypothetical protein